ncbi:hypothetical protein KP509_26G063300 [Ceratopteris richardii]|uniref:VQ domain-containing protein n=1 Tax=Ceratopteris richardii TaxID=49495 RepID=A0A8T2RNL8_CERRI|nr:hypothetical protein KP509_26G063300 [Ceratopteris richardii]
MARFDRENSTVALPHVGFATFSSLPVSPRSHAAFKRPHGASPSPPLLPHPHADASYLHALEGSDTRSNPLRVVQIFNPILVKTDAANFRCLVQRLTGKSGCSRKYWNKLRKLSAISMVEADFVTEEEDMDSSSEISSFAFFAPSDNDLEEVVSGFSQSSTNTFSELDIHEALVSDGPLPDLTMLPPLLNFPHSLCI